MGKNTGIEWCDHTWNPWHGCIKVSPGCEHCYAETLSHRWGKDIWGPAKTTGRQMMSNAYWKQPLQWDREARAQGIRAKVFCASMADVFEDHPQLEEPREKLFRLIENTPNLIWLLLTKRPENIKRMIYDSTDIKPGIWLAGMGDRVWIGTSVEDQKRADERIPHLLAIPSAVRFLSVEPLLGPIDLWGARYTNPDGSKTGAISTWAQHGINWVIVGGESGPGARPMHPRWATLIRDDCKAAGVPFFFKQFGEWSPINPQPDSYAITRTFVHYDPNKETNPHVEPVPSVSMYKVGKKLAGSLLEGVEHKEFPTLQAEHSNIR